MIFSKELEKLAEESSAAWVLEQYPVLFIKTGDTIIGQGEIDQNHGRRLFAQRVYAEGFLVGAAALENLIMKSGDNADEWRRAQKVVASVLFQPALRSMISRGQAMDLAISMVESTHEKDQLIIEGLRERRKSTKAMLDLTVEKIQQLEEDLKEREFLIANQRRHLLQLEAKLKDAEDKLFELTNDMHHVRGEK